MLINDLSFSSRMTFHINCVVYFTSSRRFQATERMWNHISSQGNNKKRPSADKSFQNRPIIVYTRIWYTPTKFC